MTADTLIDALWIVPPPTARKMVQIFVSRLRRVLGDQLAGTRGGYRLDLHPDQIDAHRFAQLVAERRYRDALALWRGPPLAGLRDEPFVAVERVRLEELRLTALEHRLEEDLARGVLSAVSDLEALVAAHPLRERFRALLMLALYRAGRQAEALGVYLDTRRLLVESFGIEPSEELRDLQRRILRHDAVLISTPNIWN